MTFARLFLPFGGRWAERLTVLRGLQTAHEAVHLPGGIDDALPACVVNGCTSSTSTFTVCSRCLSSAKSFCLIVERNKMSAVRRGVAKHNGR